jgi:iron only hydrogenase large subunit-like protein
VDAVLTTRELARMIRMRGIDLAGLEPELPDDPFGERSTAGKIFGASGGVTEAAVRTAYSLLTGRELDEIEMKGVRGLDGIKEAKIEVDGLQVGVAVVSGLGNARKLLDQIVAGRDDLHFIEIMACPGGCIAGGGQPIGTSPESIRARMAGLYSIDSRGPVRVSHRNPMVKRVYEEYLGEPLGERSHHLLHTHYAKREVLV